MIRKCCWKAGWVSTDELYCVIFTEGWKKNGGYENLKVPAWLDRAKNPLVTNKGKDERNINPIYAWALVRRFTVWAVNNVGSRRFWFWSLISWQWGHPVQNFLQGIWTWPKPLKCYTGHSYPSIQFGAIGQNITNRRAQKVTFWKILSLLSHANHQVALAWVVEVWVEVGYAHVRSWLGFSKAL